MMMMTSFSCAISWDLTSPVTADTRPTTCPGDDHDDEHHHHDDDDDDENDHDDGDGDDDDDDDDDDGKLRFAMIKSPHMW